MPGMDASERRPDDRPDDTGEAGVEVLRGIWSARGQTPAELDAELTRAPTNAKVCRNLRNVGFGADADAGGAVGAGTDAEAPVGDELRTAWRDRLAREGKLREGGTTRDLVFGERTPDGTAPVVAAGVDPATRTDR